MGRCCIKDHRPEHSLGNERWINGCAQCELEKLRAELARCGGDNCMGRRCDDVTNWVTEQAAAARVAAERERCAKLAEAMDADYLRTSPCLKALARVAAAIRRA